ncbi:MAG: hypothetical protein K2K89_00885, partial [Ruminococcus sp.]|nr:hypothetical protein [Ruminococcus sp.]
MKKFLIMFLCVMIFVFPLNVCAAYNYDYMGNAIPSQAGYNVENVLYFGMNEPQDIFFSGENFYIADTGNNRILVLDYNLENIIKIYDKFIFPDSTETQLNNPKGVYVSGEKIYIADTGNNRVIISDFNSKIITEIEKPVSEIYDQNKTFIPEKILVDKAGNIYIISGNITTGCMMFSSNGDFIGFFGVNRSERTAENIRNYFISGKKKLRRKRNIPTGINNFDIHED